MALSKIKHKLIYNRTKNPTKNTKGDYTLEVEVTTSEDDETGFDLGACVRFLTFEEGIACFDIRLISQNPIV